MNRLVTRRTAPLLLAGGLCVLMGASLSACASTKTQQVNEGSPPGTFASSPSVSASPSPSAAPTSAAPSAAGSSSASTAPAPVPTGGKTGGAGAPGAPVAQVSSLPEGAKLTPVETLTESSDGRTLYLGIESMGGACGRYDVVLQESSATVDVGLAHLPVPKGVMCPMYMGLMRFAVHLAGPLDGRPVVDLADGQRLNVS